MKPPLLIFLIVLLLIPFFLAGQAQDSQSRPKIGLTLSGGGAKGLAHIGILEAIDSAGLRIDAITGTSMGSIIGALYATGYSGDTIEQIARKIDWNRMFSTTPGLDAISIEKKDEFNKYALEVPFENGRFRLSKGIIEGQELWLKFTELFEPVFNQSDFSRFPIPFKCIGTDLETGDAVVMDHGDITTCIRASMAIPTVFTPVVYEGKTIVDGGLVNNFPVLDVKEMGASLVIGVNLNKGLEKAEELKSPVDILLQICFYKDAEHFQKHRDACDIYIMPDLLDYSAGSFTSSDSIIDIGKECAKKFYPVFKKLADSLNSIYPGEPFRKDRLPRHPPIVISEYTVEGLKHTKENFFFGMLNLHMDEPYSSRKFTEAVHRAYSSLYYSKINYEFTPTGNNTSRIRFRVEENPLTTVKFALNYNSFSSLGFIFNVTSQNLFLQESRALATIALSSDPRLYLEYYKYIGRTRDYGFNVSYYSESTGFPVYQDFRLKYNLRSSSSVFDLRFQHTLSNNTYLGIGQRFVASKIKTPESPEIIYEGKTSYLNTYVRYLLNSCDRKYFTTRGWKVQAEAGFVFLQKPGFKYSGNLLNFSSDTIDRVYENYMNFIFSADHFKPVGSRFVFSQSLGIAYINDSNPYISNKFLLGGIYPFNRNQLTFAGLAESEVKTGSIGLFKLGLQYSLARSLYLTGRFNIAYYDFNRKGTLTGNASEYFLSGYALSLGFDSLFGPLEITSMYCDQDGKLRYSINIGFSF